MSVFSYHNFRLITIVVILIILLILVFFIGLVTKRWMVRRGWLQDQEGTGVLEGALLSLFAIFMAFAFSMASDRNNSRRETIVVEANAIGTATLRADLYPDSIRNILRNDFRQYVDARIAYYEAGGNMKKVVEADSTSNRIGAKLWKEVAAHSHDTQFREATLLMVPAMNEMLDAATSRDAALKAQVPDSIIWVLLILGLCCGFIVGYGSKTVNVNYTVEVLFVIMISVTLTLIIDLDRPRQGLITNAKSNEKIEGLRSLFE